MTISIRASESQVWLPVRVTPKGGSDCVLQNSGDASAIRIKISAPPEDGKANQAIIKLLASLLGLPKSHIKIARGEKSREKQVEIRALSAQESEAICERLALVFADYGYELKRMDH